MDNLTLLLQTTHLNTFVRESTLVWVKAADGYLRKRGRDLNEGDMVLIDDKYIDTTLEQIKPSLRKRQRYVQAEDQMYRRRTIKSETEGVDDSYREVSEFRALLLEGLAQGDNDLEAKIMRDDEADFLPEQYAEFARRIKATGVTVTESQIRKWLAGEVLSPQDWDNFEKLAAINPKFEKIHQSKEKEDGYFSAWAVYTGIHKHAMAYLAKRTGENAGKNADRERKTTVPRGIADIIDVLVKDFFGDIKEGVSPSMIMKIKKVHNPGSRDRVSGETPEQGLERGLYIEDDKDLEVIDMNKVFADFYLLDVLVRNVAYIFATEICTELTRGKFLEPQNRAALNSYLSALICLDLLDCNIESTRSKEYYGRKLDAMNGTNFASMNEKLYDKIPKIWNQELVFEGLPSETITDLVEKRNKLAAILPKTFHEYLADNFSETTMVVDYKGYIPAEMSREFERIKKRSRSKTDYLLTNYGLAFGKQVPMLFGGIVNGSPRICERIERAGLRVMKEAKIIRTELEGEGYVFITHEQVRKRLVEMGFEDKVVKCYSPTNFLGDNTKPRLF